MTLSTELARGLQPPASFVGDSGGVQNKGAGEDPSHTPGQSFSFMWKTLLLPSLSLTEENRLSWEKGRRPFVFRNEVSACGST